jgi:hypothetical protein
VTVDASDELERPQYRQPQGASHAFKNLLAWRRRLLPDEQLSNNPNFHEHCPGALL